MLRIAILIDGGSDKDQYLIVRRWLSLMLLFGAMVGLLAQEVAFASAPAMSRAAVPASQMSDECAEMLKAAAYQGDKPCKGPTLDCIAKQACALPSAILSLAMPIPPKPHPPAMPDPST